MSLPKYPRYKNSGIAWLGELPVHWTTKPLWTLFRRTKRVGHEGEQLLSVYRDYGVVPKASRDDNNNKASDDLSVYQLVKLGDLTINKMKAWQGSVAISGHQGIVSPAYFVFESTHDENVHYLHYLLRSPRYITGYLSVSKGIRVNQWDLQPEYHSRMPVVVPPKAEQVAIATFLDHEIEKIDTLISEQERLVTLLAEKRQATVSRAVTLGLTADAPMKDSGVTWLGKVPAHWDIVPLKHLVSVPITDGPHESPVRRAEGIPFISAESIAGGYIDLKKAWGYISLEDHDRYSERLKPQRGDVLLVKLGATAGTAAIVETDTAFSVWVPLACIRPRPTLESRFLLHTLRSENLKRAYQLYWTYGTQQTLGLKTISELRIPLPPLPEQVCIVNYLDAETSKFEALTDASNQATALLRERRNALIAAAVTGQIDVCCASPQSAYQEELEI